MTKPLSREYLESRGYCCLNGCVNCPYRSWKSTEEHPMTEEELEELINSTPWSVVRSGTREVYSQSLTENNAKDSKYSLEYEEFPGHKFEIVTNIPWNEGDFPSLRVKK